MTQMTKSFYLMVSLFYILFSAKLQYFSKDNKTIELMVLRDNLQPVICLITERYLSTDV